MKPYNWFKKDVDKKLSELKSLPMTKKLVQAIDACEDLIFDEEDFKKYCIEDTANIAEEFYKEFLVFNHLRFLWEWLLDFYFNAQNIEIIAKPKNILISKEDATSLSHDFFKNATPKDVYFDFLKLFSQKDHFDYVYGAPSDFCAESFFIPYFNDLYVQIAPSYCFDDVSTIAHEYGHGIQNLRNYEPKLYSTNYTFIEIISTFFDFLSLDYYSRVPEFDKIAQYKLKKLYNAKHDHASNIMCFIAFIKELELEKIDNKKETIEKIKTLNPNELYIFGEIMKERKISEDIPYILGTIISIELLKIYHEDPEKAFYLINQIINIDANVPPPIYFNKILSLGIRLNNSTNYFEQHLKRELTL